MRLRDHISEAHRADEITETLQKLVAVCSRSESSKRVSSWQIKYFMKENGRSLYHVRDYSFGIKFVFNMCQ